MGEVSERVEGEVTALMERRISRYVVGVMIFRSEDSISVWMVVSTPKIGGI